MQQRNLFLFAALTLLLLLGYATLKPYFTPAPATKKPTPTGKPTEPDKKKTPTEQAPGVLVRLPHREATPTADLITLGSDRPPASRDAPNFHLRVVLDPRGAGVRSVVLNKFQHADMWGRPLWLDADKKVPAPLELVPDEANRLSPSSLLYHYDTTDEDPQPKPLDTLGRIRWKPVSAADGEFVHEEKIEKDGQNRLVQRVAFQAEIDGVRITKTYSLLEKEYHVGLEVRVERLAGAEGERWKRFRYQLTGMHGLPVEGKWYTSVFQNALIAREDAEDGQIDRDVQTLQEITQWGGGRKVIKVGQGEGGEKDFIRYAVVAVQYFASGIVVDNHQVEYQGQDFLDWARPTLETRLSKGTVERVGPGGAYLIVKVEAGTTQTFQVPEGPLRFEALDYTPLKAGEKVRKKRIAIVHSAVSYDDKVEGYPQRVDGFLDPDEAPDLWSSDITVRVVSDPFSLDDGPVVHRYLLYNGPVKVALLDDLPDERRIAPALQQRYTGPLHLNTLTDYHTPGFFGRFANSIYLTDVIIKCTNLMHWVLGHLQNWIPSYGLCIIVLTILVRGLMFPVSRKQAMTSIKMQALAPEIKKLQEKHKDDRQALMQAQMELWRRHRINPLGTCWFLLLQMPIFMGLYWALQENFHFRLASFWPTWIVNLSAPDMLLWWSDAIPMISAPYSYGGLLYLGPYLNLLPIIAVTLMIAQQKLMTPPALDEQQAMQQKMMTYMMVLFCFFFYKVAAGLCVYFIASSLWGFAERKLLPKKKKPEPEADPPPEGMFQKLLAKVGPKPALAGGTAITTEPAASGVTENKGKNRRQERHRRRQERIRTGQPGAGPAPAAEVPGGGGVRSWWTRRLERLRTWWEDLLEQARKK